MLPKIIWIYWHQGWKSVSDIPKICLESWCSLNNDWDIKNIDYKDVKNLIPDIVIYEKKNLPLQALSDVIRIYLLNEFGGVWADSTVLCNRPLNNWLYSYLKEGFFAYSHPTHDRLVASWFLASLKNHLITKKWHEKTKIYWKIHEIINSRYQYLNKFDDEYYWFHHLFNKIYNEDLEIKQIWDKVPKLSVSINKAEGPHFFIPYAKKFKQPLSFHTKETIYNKNIAMFKLTWEFYDRKENETLDYLLNNWGKGPC